MRKFFGTPLSLAAGTLAGVAAVASSTSCSEAFTSCEARRTCPQGGASGQRSDQQEASGTSGVPVGGTFNGPAGGADGHTPLHGGAAGGESMGFGGTDGADEAAGASGLGEQGGSKSSGGDADAGAAGEASDRPQNLCGNGQRDGDEDCDLGKENRADAWGPGLCTSECRRAPFCGDGIRNGPEVCDSGGLGKTELGACNPECTGFYEKKYGRLTSEYYSTNLGGIAGADAKCGEEFGPHWKALLVGGSRRATVNPFVGDGQSDWVVQKYTHYYNIDDQLVWRTDEIPLLGVRSGMRFNLYATFFADSGSYPWAGYRADWTTIVDEPGSFAGTCDGWTSSNAGEGAGSFVLSDLATTASEPCGSTSFILCIEQ